MNFDSRYLFFLFSFFSLTDAGDCQLASVGLIQSVVIEVEFCSMILSILRLWLKKQALSMAMVQEQIVWQKSSLPLQVST